MPEYRFDEIAINSKEKKKPTEEDKYTYIGLEHLDTGSLTVSRWGSEIAPTGDKLVMRKGDVLFGKRRAYQKKVAIAPFDGIFSAHGMVLRPREEVITKDFFPLFISSDYFLDEAIKISVGSLSPTINWSDLKELTFTIPTLEEQKKLAPVIWAAIDTKNAYKKLLLGIDELVKSQFIEMFGAVTKKAQLQDLSDMVTVGIANAATHAYSENGVLMFRNQNIKANGLDDSDLIYIKPEFAKKYAAKTLKANDILVTRTGYPGTACIVPEKYAGAQTFTTLIVRLKQSSDLLPPFVCHYINSEVGQEYVKQNEGGSAQVNFGATALSKMPIILPSVEQQKRYLTFVEQSDKSKFVVEQLLNTFHHIHLTVKED